MANLAAVQPPQDKEPTIADMIRQAHKGIYDLHERMLNLGERAGVNPPATGGEQNPVASNFQSLAQDLLREISACHEAMNNLDRIA